MTEDGKHCSIEQKEVRLVYLHETIMLSIHFYFENHLFCITISEMLYFICTLREKFVIYTNSTQYVAGYCTIACPVFDLIDELIKIVSEKGTFGAMFLIVTQTLD